MNDVFTWIATVLALTGTVLNCKKMKWCFYFWTVTNAMWLVYDFNSGLISRGVLDTVQLGLALYGIKEWSKQEKTNKKRSKKQ